MPQNRRIHALMATARVANVPSIVSNVMLGVAAWWISGAGCAGDHPWEKIATSCLSGILLYAGGNFFNDWMDADWDARHRPERALPAGIFHRRTYGIAALFLGLAGLAMAGWVGPAAGRIAGGIALGVVAYTVLHKRVAWAVGFMGFCRGALVWLGAAAFSPDGLQWNVGVALASAAVGGYIVALSLAARRESCPTPLPSQRISAAAGFFLAVPALLLASPELRALGPWCLAGLAPFAAWMVVCQRSKANGVAAYVSALLAGIPLVDWILMLPAGICGLSHGRREILFMDLAVWIVPAAAFVAALALQRLTPAT